MGESAACIEALSYFLLFSLEEKKVNPCKGKTWTSSDHLADCGYSSGPGGHPDCASGTGSSSLPSSPDGSEVACSDGFCNGMHTSFTFLPGSLLISCLEIAVSGCFSLLCASYFFVLALLKVICYHP